MSVPAFGLENICVESVGSGQKSAGQLDDPENLWNFGWFKGSPAPGVKGEGIYTCHSGREAGTRKTLLCNELVELKNDDEIIVEVASGKKFTYLVREVKVVPYREVDMVEFQNTIPGYEQGLSLMSCTGTWMVAENTYDHRLTVRAVLKES
jgi:sortase (surface protein transpeptidase)